MAILFDYDKFFKYYSNPSNFYKSSISIKVNFFRPVHGLSTRDTDYLSDEYFVVDDKDIYITIIENEIIFTILRTDKYNAYWADHFHIGRETMKNVYRKKDNSDLVFFHFSFQNFEQNKKDMSEKCNFRNRFEDINDIGNIMCSNRSSTNPVQMKDMMKSYFSIVEHILRKPFVASLQMTGGKILNRIKQKYNGKPVYVGSRKGLYTINKNGKCVCIKINKTK